MVFSRNTFYIVQSRPITTLYPIPEENDGEKCIYISWSPTNDDRCDETIRVIFFLLTTSAPMRKAGGRLFVDATQQLASPASRDYLINTLGKSDPLIRDALTTIIERDNFITLLPDDEKKRVLVKVCHL